MKDQACPICGQSHKTSACDTVGKSDLDGLVMRLRRYNEWRRGAEFDQPEPGAIGRDIDDAIAVIEQNAQRCQSLEDEVERLMAALKTISEDETDYPRQVAKDAINA